jgi:hypothetical protein
MATNECGRYLSRRYRALDRMDSIDQQPSGQLLGWPTFAARARNHWMTSLRAGRSCYAYWTQSMNLFLIQLLVSHPCFYSESFNSNSLNLTNTSIFNPFNITPVATMTDVATWARSALESVFLSHTDEAFSAAFAATFDPGVSVRTASAGENDIKAPEEVQEQDAGLTPGKGDRVEEASGDDAKTVLEKHLRGAAMTENARVEWGDVTERDGPVSTQAIFSDW